MLGVVVSGIAFYVLSQYLGDIPLFRWLVLKTPHTGPAGGTSAGVDAQSLAGMAVSGHEVIGAGKISPGATGRVAIPLRPSGRVEIEGQLVDAVSRGEWIETGRPIRVLEAQGNRIVVEEWPR
jgi:membrane-bound serine protease (ClpP class)